MKNLVCNTYGSWKVLYEHKRVGGSRYWICLCECGTIRPVIQGNLVTGKSTRCGIGACNTTNLGEKARERHPLYSTWKSMRNRCNNKNNYSYKYYGGRGIKVCEDWSDFNVFVNDMLPTYSEGLTLDRIDNNGNYCVKNCRWATTEQQSVNKSDNVYIEYNGELLTESQFSKKYGIRRTTVQSRRDKGWSPEEILFGRDNRKYLIDGVKYNQKELATYLGISPQLLCKRFKKGYFLEELINEFRRV